MSKEEKIRALAAQMTVEQIEELTRFVQSILAGRKNEDASEKDKGKI